MFKPSGNHRDDSEAPKPSEETLAPQGLDLEGRVIFRIPQGFDINDVFRSELELSGATASSTDAELKIREQQSVSTRSVVTQTFLDESWKGGNAVEAPAADPQLSMAGAKASVTLSVADLIENNVRLDWQEAVAIAQHLCHAASGDPTTNIQRELVEPWNVEITDFGDVRVLPGGPGSNPTVKEVGRILSALLQGTIAPVDLRLLASQASFDVPMFGSVAELSQALRHFERPGDSDAIRRAFSRGVEAKFSTPAGAAKDTVVVPATLHEAVPAKESVPAKPKLALEQPEVGRWRWIRLSALASSLLAVLTLLTWTLMSAREPAASTAAEIAPSATPASAKPADVDLLPDEALVIPQGPEEPTPPITRSIARSAEAAPPTALRARPLARAADAGPGAAPQRATELRAAGRSQDQSLAFDAIVMAQPFYQPPPGSSPEVQVGIQASKRVLLPTLARSRYDSARAAFEAGDLDRALADGRLAALMLRDSNSAPMPDWSAGLDRFLALAAEAKAVEEQKIYTAGDSDVIPPIAIGLQMPGAPPPGVSRYNVGQLEMLIGRSGQVETVRLHTPANRYAERMIVSAAKAWKYRPALKNGKPVRFSLVVSINLPES